MDHDLFGPLEHRRRDEAWTGGVVLRHFAMFGTENEDEAELQRRRDGILPLRINDPAGTGPQPRQEAAFRHLRDHEADVFRVVLESLFQSYQACTSSPLGGFWDWVGGLLGVKPIKSPDDLAEQAHFNGVELTQESKNGSAYVLFDADCSWEPEHGMLIVYHKDVPASWTTVDALELDSD
jgi:hypothetical protein